MFSLDQSQISSRVPPPPLHVTTKDTKWTNKETRGITDEFMQKRINSCTIVKFVHAVYEENNRDMVLRDSVKLLIRLLAELLDH